MTTDRSSDKQEEKEREVRSRVQDEHLRNKMVHTVLRTILPVHPPALPPDLQASQTGADEEREPHIECGAKGATRTGAMAGVPGRARHVNSASAQRTRCWIGLNSWSHRNALRSDSR